MPFVIRHIYVTNVQSGLRMCKLHLCKRLQFYYFVLFLISLINVVYVYQIIKKN